MNDPLHALLVWLSDHGGQCADLSICQQANGERFVRADRSFAIGELIMSLPYTCLWTADDARRGWIGRTLGERGVNLGSDLAYLAAALLVDFGRGDSPWRAYIDALPSDFSHLPLFFPEAQCQWLTGSLVLEQLHEQRELVQAEQCLLAGVMPKFAWEHYPQARAAVFSRAFSVRITGRSLTCLVPLVDLCNHANDANADWSFDSTQGRFLLRARRDIAAGVEIQHCYGRYSNSRLLLHYGFCLEDNPHQEALVRIPLGDGTEDAVNWRAMYLTADADCEGYRAYRQFMEVTRGHLSAAAVEAEVRYRLIAAIRQASAAFPTSLASDETLLQTELMPAMRHCVLARRSEKQVLRAWQSRLSGSGS